MDKNVQIPLTLFTRIIEFLEFMDAPEYASHHWQEYDSILCLLRKKKERIELRDTYAKIVYAKDDDTRHNARINYLQHRRDVKGSF